MAEGMHDLSQAIGRLEAAAEQRLRGEQSIFIRLDTISGLLSDLSGDIRATKRDILSGAATLVQTRTHIEEHCKELRLLKSYIDAAKGASWAMKLVWALITFIGVGGFTGGVAFLVNNAVEARATELDRKLERIERTLPGDPAHRPPR